MTRSSAHIYATLGLLAVLACDEKGRAGTAAPPDAPPEHAAHGAEGDHEHDEETSDLDRPVEELFAQTCEHAKRTFECEECRYEVGVARAPAALIDGGLVKTMKATLRKVEVPVTLTGEVRFDERRIGHVSSQVEGVVKKVHVALGDRVKSGQALLEIESVAIGEAQSSFREEKAMLELARRNFERVAQLREERIASEKEYLQARQALETAKIRAEGALGKLGRLGSGGDAGGRVVLRAPTDGSVLVMHAVAGEVARTDEPLVTVGDSAAVWVWADLYERDLAAVRQAQDRQGLGALVSVKAYPGVEFPGTVDLISPAMDESSRTVKLRAEVQNADGRLLAGMFATVKLFLPGNAQALSLPRDAVLEDEGRSFVFIHHHDDFYVRRPVAVGRTWPGWVEITRGVTPAQTVVTAGAFLLKSDVLRSKMGAGCAD